MRLKLTGLVVAAGLAAAGAALPTASQAAHVLMSLQGQTSTVFQYHVDLGGVRYSDFQWDLTSRDFPATVAQGDTVNSTVRFDAPITVGASTVATYFDEFISSVDWLDSPTPTPAEVRGRINFFSGVDLVASLTYDSTSTSGLNAFIPTFAPDNPVFTFDSFINAFTIVSLESPQTLELAQFSYTTLSPIDGVPEPATWGLLVGGFALAGTALRRRARRPART